jgi:phage-related protein
MFTSFFIAIYPINQHLIQTIIRIIKKIQKNIHNFAKNTSILEKHGI